MENYKDGEDLGEGIPKESTDETPRVLGKDEALAIFNRCVSGLAEKIGKKSPNLRRLKHTQGHRPLTPQEYQQFVLQEGSARLDSYVKAAIANIGKMVGSGVPVSLLDVFTISMLIFTDAVRNGMVRGWDCPDRFIDEQSTMFSAALGHIIEHHRRVQKLGDGAPKLEKPLIEVVH